MAQSVGGLGACRLKLMPTVVGLWSAAAEEKEKEGPAAECRTRRRGPAVPALKPPMPSSPVRVRRLWLRAAGGGIADSG